VYEWDVGAQRLGTIDLQWRNVIEIVLQDNEHRVLQESAAWNFLKGQAWKNITGTDVRVPRRKMETLGGRVSQPSRPFNTRQKMYLMEGERLAAPRIHHAMGRRDDEVARNQRTSAPLGAAVAGRVDLTDCRPRCALLVNHFPVVSAEDARLQIACGCLNDGEGTRDAEEAMEDAVCA